MEIFSKILLFAVVTAFVQNEFSAAASPVQGDQTPPNQGTAVGQSQNTDAGGNNNAPYSMNNLQICASSARGGTNPNGDEVPEITLSSKAQVWNCAPNAHLYLCLNTEAQREGVKLVNKVVYKVFDQGSNTAVFSRVDNSAPFEAETRNSFNSDDVIKRVEATLTGYDGTERTVEGLLDFRPADGAGKRRHLRGVSSK